MSPGSAPYTVRIVRDHSPPAVAGRGEPVRDIEAQILARAVEWHSESRVPVNGNCTVVFRRRDGPGNHAGGRIPP
ncbi:hypothetical protein ACFV7R_31415 [Streptomyces sp. NPDC059866]|uniref:hypothetical protein n=1 Tax=Streptomyces sp. NPDC059866 TaxID=3346978 RepID=UPI003648394B